MLQRFYNYIKLADELIDKISLTLKQLSDEIFDLVSNARSFEISRVAIIINACEREKYTIAKYTLNQVDILILALAVEQLRSIKQNIKNSVNVAKNNRGKQRDRKLFDKSKVECYKYYEFDYFKSKYLKDNENKN